MASIAESVEHFDFSCEQPTRVVWALAWPVVALNTLQVLNNLLDRAFLGRLEPAALTAQGAAINVTFLMFSLAMALATGPAALVSRAYGAEDMPGARTAAQQAFRVAMLIGCGCTAATVLIASPAAHMILPKSDPRAIILMAQYVSIFALSLPAFFVIQALAGSLRGIGDTKSPMVLSGIQIMLHMCLNFLLVFPSRHVLGVQMPGAGWGLAGAASALTISTCVSAIGYVLWVRNTPLRNVWSARLPSLDWATRILKIAIPAAVTSTLRVLSMTTFTLVLAMTASGSVAIAAMSTGFTIESVMYMPSFGLAAAAGALVGQSLGANRPDRAERLGWIAAHHAALVTAALAIPLMIWARPVASLLLENKPDMIAQSALLLRYLCATEVMFAYAMVANGAMQGAGDTVRPMWISILSLWLIRVPMAFLVVLPAGQQLFGGVSLPVGLGLGSAGAWLTLSFSQGIQGVLALVLYGQGRWKTQRV